MLCCIPEKTLLHPETSNRVSFGSESFAFNLMTNSPSHGFSLFFLRCFCIAACSCATCAFKTFQDTSTVGEPCKTRNLAAAMSVRQDFNTRFLYCNLMQSGRLMVTTNKFWLLYFLREPTNNVSNRLKNINNVPTFPTMKCQKGAQTIVGIPDLVHSCWANT